MHQRMKKLLLFLYVLTALCSCSSNTVEEVTDNPMVGTWKLVEIYSDPGDGSGTFLPVESDKTLNFDSKGGFVCAGTLCNPSWESVGTSKGTYSVSEQTIRPDNCENPTELPYELDGNYLIISFFCIEGCGEKYLRMD